MTFVVAEPCIRCKHTDCVDVCPVDCFYEGVNFLVIDPDECIRCGACVPECPVEAIYPDDELPDKWSEYLEINARLAPAWPVITVVQASLPDADEWAAVSPKGSQLDPAPAERR